VADQVLKVTQQVAVAVLQVMEQMQIHQIRLQVEEVQAHLQRLQVQRLREQAVAVVVAVIVMVSVMAQLPLVEQVLLVVQLLTQPQIKVAAEVEENLMDNLAAQAVQVS
jgi:hypothetical protein